VPPAVSVIIPTCDAGPFIAGTLASVTCQTIDDFEVIVIDAASSDDTVDIVAAHAERDPRLRFHPLTRRTPPPVTRNIALEHATAPVVALLDADDQMYPDRLERQLHVLRTEPSAVVVGGPLVMVDHLGVPTDRVIGEHGRVATDALVRFMLGFGAPTLASALTMRTDVLRAAGGFDEDNPWADDYSLCARLLDHGTMEMLERPVGCYRLHHSQVTKTQADNQRLDVAILRQRLIGRILGRLPDLATVLTWTVPLTDMADEARSQALADLHEYRDAFCAAHALTEAEVTEIDRQVERRRARIMGETPHDIDGEND
jgi:glycosyltransferase involved in cell wall biosynthesis